MQSSPVSISVRSISDLEVIRTSFCFHGDSCTSSHIEKYDSINESLFFFSCEVIVFGVHIVMI